MVQKIYWKIHPVTCTNTHYDVIDLVNHGMVKNTKPWICSITFLRNKKIWIMCLRWDILRSYPVNKAIYRYASERSRYALSENSIVCYAMTCFNVVRVRSQWILLSFYRISIFFYILLANISWTVAQTPINHMIF